ncbi:MAG: amino acid ABC transporter permease [Coriobacteriales bacterium]|jgi:polar amino acid transport system substrate-binding protein|nr:amino acid ABC transporter permease [Coriobacteriales bacterium]
MRDYTVIRALRTALAFVMVLSLFVFLSASPPAFGLTLAKTTAKPNEPDGNAILGGQPTRVTWEATVGADEQVTSITLEFPAGCALGEDANSKATVLEDTTRLSYDFEQEISATSTTVDFAEPVESGLFIRIEVYNLALPTVAGDYYINATYLNANGERIEVAGPQAISVKGTTGTQQIIDWLDGQPWVEAWNSALFLKIFFSPQLIVAAIPNLFIGWLRSLGLVLVGFPLAIPIGLAISFLRMARLGILRLVSSIYVNVIRGTPLFLQMYIAFFGLPLLGVRVDSYLLGILVLAMNSSAYLAEIFRAGIQSIHKGQFEASASLGMNAFQTMFSVIIPQTVRRVIPTATSEFILLYKDTSLLAAVGVMEQMMFAKSMVASTGNMTPYVVAACYYLLVTLPLTRIISSFEKKLAASEGQSSQPPAPKKKRGLPWYTRPAPLVAVDAEASSAITADEQSSGR